MSNLPSNDIQFSLVEEPAQSITHIAEGEVESSEFKS